MSDRLLAKADHTPVVAPDAAQEFTEALGQVLAGAVRLADVATEMGVPQALGLSPEEWAKRRLSGQVRLSIPERRKVVAELTERGVPKREIADALGVDERTVQRDRNPVETPVFPSAPAQAWLEETPVSEIPNGRDRTALFTSDSPEWATPQDLFDVLNAEFNFDVDVCATPDNAKCETYFTAEQDGLAQDWHGACWMNPPYGNVIGDWMAKAHKEHQRNGTAVVCLVPARVDTGWWWDHARYGEVRFLRGRLKFGDGDTGAPFPSAVVVFADGYPASVVWWEQWQTV